MSTDAELDASVASQVLKNAYPSLSEQSFHVFILSFCINHVFITISYPQCSRITVPCRSKESKQLKARIINVEERIALC